MRLKMREILYRGKPKNKEHSYFFSEIWKSIMKTVLYMVL